MNQGPHDPPPSENPAPASAAGEPDAAHLARAAGVWSRIKEHKLIQWGLGYVGAALALAHGQELIAHAFAWPEIVGRLLIGALALGLPVVLTLAWYHGHKGLKRLSAGELTIVSLLLLIGAGLLMVFVRPAEHTPAEQTVQTAPTKVVPEGAAAAPASSLAVLAFNNMSGEKDNEYFSDGISEELLNDLAQVPGLRVAGRTSSFSFKGKNVTIQEIGKALNVRAVLEGSVRRVGNRVRITAQLVNAADDFHIWSQDYDREIADIFAVQDEIAKAITHELTGRLLPAAAAGAAAKPKINPDAYTAYLQGRFFLAKRNKPDMLRAVDFFKQAIALEPNFADAHASLGRTFALLYANGQSRDTLQPAKDETAAALQIDPDNFQAQVSNGLIAILLWNWQGAQTTLRRATELNPNDPDAQHFTSMIFGILDLPAASILPERRAAILDPLAPVIRDILGDIFHRLGKNAEAVAEYQAALTLDPNFVFSLASLCRIDVEMGKIDEAKEILTTRLIAVDGEDGPDTSLCRATIAAHNKDLPELRRQTAIASHLYASGDATASRVALIYSVAGDVDGAMHWFGKAYDDHDTSLLISKISGPGFSAKLKADPRWKAFMQRPLLKEWQAAHDRVAAELAAGK